MIVSNLYQVNCSKRVFDWFIFCSRKYLVEAIEEASLAYNKAVCFIIYHSILVYQMCYVSLFFFLSLCDFLFDDMGVYGTFKYKACCVCALMCVVITLLMLRVLTRSPAFVNTKVLIPTLIRLQGSTMT